MVRMDRHEPFASLRHASVGNLVVREHLPLHHTHIFHAHEHNHVGALLPQEHHLFAHNQKRLVQSVPTGLLEEYLLVHV